MKTLGKNGKIKEYTVTSNYSKHKSLRIILNHECGFNPGDKVYQVKRDDGVVELVPIDVYDKLYSQSENE